MFLSLGVKRHKFFFKLGNPEMTLRTVLCDGKKSVSVYYTDDEYCFPRYGFATDAYASDSSGSLRDS